MYESRLKALYKRKIELQDLIQSQRADGKKHRDLSTIIRIRAKTITKLTDELLDAI